MTVEVIAFPFVEALLREALGAHFSEPIVTKVPKGRDSNSGPLIKLVRVGGTQRDVVTDQPMVVFQAWAKTDAAAGDLGRLLRAHVFALEHTSHPLGWIGGIREIGGLQSMPDPISGSAVYQFTVQIDTRGVAIDEI